MSVRNGTYQPFGRYAWKAKIQMHSVTGERTFSSAEKRNPRREPLSGGSSAYGA